MKRRIKLRGELILAIVIAIVVSGVIAFPMYALYKDIFLNEKRLNDLAAEKNNNAIEIIEKQLNIKNKNEKVVIENINRIEKILSRLNSGRVFLVDNNGYVKFSTGKMAIEKIELIGENYRKISIIGSQFIAVNVMKLNEERYVVYLNENNIYDDMILMEIWAVLGFIVFLILINKRIKYINQMAKEVRETIAKGQLSHRIILKYNNELTDLAKDINYMTEEIDKQDKNQREFITNISHDLRTPLTTMLGYSKMLEDKVYSSEEELERYISIINKKGNYLKAMIENFFDYAKISSQDIAIEKMNINLNEVIRQLLDDEDEILKEKNLIIEFKSIEKSIHTIADPMLIARAIGNLIGNALKYSRSNTIIKIEVNKERRNEINYGIFSIENVAKNKVSYDDSKKLLNRLYKVNKSRNEEGSGLGLAITKEIITSHDGFIETDINEDKIKFIVGLICK